MRPDTVRDPGCTLTRERIDLWAQVGPAWLLHELGPEVAITAAWAAATVQSFATNTRPAPTYGRRPDDDDGAAA